MPQLEASARAERTEEVPAGEFSVTLAFRNGSNQPARLNLHQASHPALVLDVRDSKGDVVLLAPPSGPDEQDLAPGEPIAPGAEVTVSYSGFLDRDLPPGEYRVRYFGEFEPLGGSKDDPLVSDWLVFSVRRQRGFPPGERIPGLQPPLPPGSPPERIDLSTVVLRAIVLYVARIRCWIVCWFTQRLGGRSCNRILASEFDEARTETISNAPAGSEAWNGTYSWHTRFLLGIDESLCWATVTIRVRLVGAITPVQRAAWETAIEAAWNNRFKLCAGCWCCCPDGIAIVCDIQFVTSAEHQVVNVGTTTTNMGNWGASDTVDISHEFGHMLGALDEYFTVNGTNWGLGRQPTGAVMNNPANPPAARHYETVRAAATSLLSSPLQTIAQGTGCP
jgi:hypothetical protein